MTASTRFGDAMALRPVDEALTFFETEAGKIVVKRIVAASDVGPISNPDGLRNQVEGGALQGLSRCLGEEVTWDNEKITSGSSPMRRACRMLRLRPATTPTSTITP